MEQYIFVVILALPSRIALRIKHRRDQKLRREISACRHSPCQFYRLVCMFILLFSKMYSLRYKPKQSLSLLAMSDKIPERNHS